MVETHDIKTPTGQLALLCLVLGNPDLPRQQLNRILQCRMAWRKDKGLPPTYRRALMALSEFAPKPKPKNKGGRPKKVKEPEDV